MLSRAILQPLRHFGKPLLMKRHHIFISARELEKSRVATPAQLRNLLQHLLRVEDQVLVMEDGIVGRAVAPYLIENRKLLFHKTAMMPVRLGRKGAIVRHRMAEKQNGLVRLKSILM